VSSRVRLAWAISLRRLTVKLRGRAEARGHGAEGAQFLSARGAKPISPHGPLQRLLEGSLRRSHRASPATTISSM